MIAAGDYAWGSLDISDAVHYLVTEAHPPVAPIEHARLPYARREGSLVGLTRDPEHEALVRGLVKAGSGEGFTETEAALDALLLALSDGEQNLKLGYVDERYWKARLSGRPTIVKRGGILYEYDATFLIADPYAYSASASSLAPGSTQLTLT